MKLVIDANILFAALIKEGLTAELLISDKLQLFAPEFLFTEFAKYEKLILKKTYRSHKEFYQLLDLLKEQITIIPKKEIIPFIDKARKISPDPKDTVYLALAFLLDSNIWSNDKRLKQSQQKITVFPIEELIKKTNLLKS
ncbi:MAG: DNA-binding protein [Candidatus Lokiarchaeota archaeon]|nr:DNA-binding protein [Candidatus Lokiarchaeota archaeon]